MKEPQYPTAYDLRKYIGTFEAWIAKRVKETKPVEPFSDDRERAAKSGSHSAYAQMQNWINDHSPIDGQLQREEALTKLAEQAQDLDMGY